MSEIKQFVNFKYEPCGIVEVRGNHWQSLFEFFFVNFGDSIILNRDTLCRTSDILKVYTLNIRKLQRLFI